MANKKIIDRQHPFVAMCTLTKANIGAGNGCEFRVRPGALVTDVKVFTATAFDTAGAGTATATVGDGTTVFANAVDLKTIGAETTANAPKFYPTGGVITASVAETVATTSASVGQAFVAVTYIIDGNGNAGIEE